YIFNEIKISVPQTVLVSAISVIKDVRKAMTMDFKAAGDVVIVVGKTYPELGGSEYFSMMDRSGNIPPKVRGTMAKRIFSCVEKAIRLGIIRSCHDVSDGGIACAIAESAFAGGLGVDVDLSKVSQIGIFREDFLLFSESQSRFVLSVKEKDLEQFQKIFRAVPYGVIGAVRNDGRFLIRGLDGNVVIDTGIDLLIDAWQKPFREMFK
ncbi:MAG: AIR synthase-related protein, partial [Syntrophorhabdaceae bacterium]|nr:AIR synthase-related protein [Syntrophorhabdaceae bacterium]